MKEYTPTKISIHEIIRKLNKGLLSIHHALQRTPGHWTSEDKGNYISDILQGLPMPELVLAEEESYGRKIVWILDGVQRTSNIKDFIDNKFSISKKIERYMIEYVVPVVDEDGVQKKDEDGKPISEIKYFDIRGKKFKQLPQEMQDEFMYYKFDAVLYQDCSEENIAYHLKRYNAGKPMNTEQKGFTFAGSHFANIIKNISSLSFFEDAIGKYTLNDFKTGKINRVIAESIMTTKYLDKWSKDYATNCRYIKDNASNEDFEFFRGLVERLEDNIDATVGKMFDSKNSFLWFGLYAKFVKLGLNDEKFNEFMLKLNKGMYSYDENGRVIKDAPMTGVCTVEIDGITFEKLLKNASTKDANVVKTRIEFLAKLMCNHLGVDVPIDENNSDGMNNELEEFAQNFASDDLAIETLMLTTNGHAYNDFDPETLNSVIRWYKQYGNKTMLNDSLSYKSYLEDVGISEEDINLPLYVYAVKYIFDNDIDIDIDEWLTEFKKDAFKEIDGDSNNAFVSNNTVVMKQQEIISNINKFLTKGVEENESI